METRKVQPTDLLWLAALSREGGRVHALRSWTRSRQVAVNRLSNFSQMVDGAKAVLELWLQLLICCYVDITGVLILQSDSIMSEKKLSLSLSPPPHTVEWAAVLGWFRTTAVLYSIIFWKCQAIVQSETPASTLEDKQIVNKVGVFIAKKWTFERWLYTMTRLHYRQLLTNNEFIALVNYTSCLTDVVIFLWYKAKTSSVCAVK